MGKYTVFFKLCNNFVEIIVLFEPNYFSLTTFAYIFISKRIYFYYFFIRKINLLCI